MGKFGFIRRFICFISNLGLAHLVFFFFITNNTFKSFYKILREMIGDRTSFYADYGEFISTYIFIYLLSVLLRFIFTLLLKVDLFEFLYGVRASGNGVTTRLMGSFRVFIDGMLLPFIIPLFIYFKDRRTIGEKITGQDRYWEKSIFFNIMAGFSPFFIVAMVLSPLLEDLIILKPLKIGDEVFKVQEKSKSKDQFKKIKLYASNRFKFSTISGIENERFKFLPGFRVIRNKDKKKIRPFLKSYDKKKKGSFEFIVKSRIDLLSLIEKSKEGNPLFKKNYPEISKALKRSRSHFKKVKEKRGPENIKLYNPVLEEEIENILEQSLFLSLDKVSLHLMDYGPFLKGYVNLRKSFLKLFSDISVDKICFTTIGKNRFVQVTGSSLDDKNLKNLYLLAISTNNSILYEFSWNKSEINLEDIQSFGNDFFSKVEWFFDYEKIFDFNQDIESLTTFDIIDYFTSQNFKPENREIFEQYIFKRLYKLSYESINFEDQSLMSIIESTIEKMSIIAKLQNKDGRKVFSKKMVNLLNQLRYSLKVKDFDYFKENNEN